MRFLKKNNIWPVVLAALILHLISSFYNVGFYNMDEHFQILGPVEYLLGFNKELFTEIWEFTDAGRIRPWFQSYLYYYIIRVLIFIGLNDPFIWTFILRLIGSAFGLLTTILFYNLVKQDYKIDNLFSKIIILLFWFYPLIHTRTSSENLGFSFFLLGLIFVIKIYKNKGNIILNSLLIGVFLGISILIRYHYIIFIFGIFFHLLFFNISYKKIGSSLITAIIIFIIFAFGILIDSIAYKEFNVTILNYFKINNDHAFESFGQEPFWYYLSETLITFSFPLSIVLVFSTILFFINKPKDLLTYICLPYLVILSYLTHKELRFIFPVLELSPFFLAYVFGKYQFLQKSYIKNIIIIFNSIYLILIFIPLSNEVKIYELIYKNQNEINIEYYKESPYKINDLTPKLYTVFLNDLKKYEHNSNSDTKLIIFKHLDDYNNFYQKNDCDYFYSVFPIKIVNFLSNSFQHMPKWYIAKCY